MEENEEVTAEAIVVEDLPVSELETTETPAPPALSERGLETVAPSGRPQRMSPAEEDASAAALKTRLSGSKEELDAAILEACQLPWNVAVKGVSLAWPELTVTAKRSFFTALNRLDTDQGKRLRLSLSRGLFKIDPASGIKVAASLCTFLKKSSEDKGLPGKERQAFFNVLIGKGKPWLLQWKWEDFKPAEATALSYCAISSVFQSNSPPLTQSSILRWSAGSGKIEKLSEELSAAVHREIGRWKGKLKEETRRELPPDSPQWLNELLATPVAPVPAEPPKENTEKRGAGQSLRSHQQPRGESDTRKPSPRLSPPPPPQPSAPARGGSSDPIPLLRQLETHFQNLRNDLTTAKAQVRQRDEEIRKLKRGGSKRRGKSDGETPQLEDPQYDTEEISRHNRQLEERVAELQARLADLAQEDEDQAHSRQAGSDGTEAGGMEQVKTLISFKLEERHKHFVELCEGPQNEVLSEHYRMLIAGLFSDLANLGISFSEHSHELPTRAARSLKSWKSE